MRDGYVSCHLLLILNISIGKSEVYVYMCVWPCGGGGGYAFYQDVNMLSGIARFGDTPSIMQLSCMSLCLFLWPDVYVYLHVAFHDYESGYARPIND